jgi:4-amino-4-deoxy-L-arabinose transferase-like glycosyltransferase
LNTEPAAVDSNPSTSESPSLGWRAWLLILSISIAACCFKLGDARALTEHEVWVAGGAKQMAVDHDWLFPKIGDQLWIEKPPLLHWLIVASAKLFGGFSEITARLPSVLAGLGIVVAMTKLALHWFGARVAIFTALVQATTVHFITYARLAEAEMLLAFFIVAALFVFARLHSIGGAWPQPQRHLALLFWTLVGLSNLAKGLGFGAAVILAPCVAYLLLKRDPAAWRRMISWPGFVIGIVIGLAWPIAVALRAPEASEIWFGQLQLRAGGGMYDEPWWYYLTSVPWQLLPWTPALLVAAGPSFTRARRQSDSPDRFIWCWVIVPIVMLTFSHGKHHHYIIAPLCALSPLCAVGLLRFGTRFAAACVALVVAGILFVNARIMPTRDRCRDDCEFLKSVRSFVPPDTPLWATGGQEIARHIFYVDPPPQGIFDAADLEKYFNNTPFYLITRRREEPRLKKFGRVDVITESRYTRGEHSPADRFTLFRVEPERP